MDTLTSLRRVFDKGVADIVKPIGFERAPKPVFGFSRPRGDGHVTAVTVQHPPPWSYASTARAAFVTIGIAESRELHDMRTYAAHDLQRVLQSDESLERVRALTGRIVGDIGVLPGRPDMTGEWVARMIRDEPRDATIRHHNAMWYASREHVDLWLEYLQDTLPEALVRVERAELDRSHLVARLALAD